MSIRPPLPSVRGRGTPAMGVGSSTPFADHAETARPLGDEQAAVGEERDAPRVRQAAGDDGHADLAGFGGLELERPGAQRRHAQPLDPLLASGGDGAPEKYDEDPESEGADGHWRLLRRRQRLRRYLNGARSRGRWPVTTAPIIRCTGSHMRRISLVLAAAATLLVVAIDAQPAATPRRYILAAGRRLPYLYVVSLDAALDPANDRTPKAIVGRSKVAIEATDGRLLGDPANLVVSEDGRTVYVVNHHGAVDNETFRQHGGRGQIAVLDVDDLLAPANDGTATALRRHMDSGGFGALGLVLLPELLVVGNAENHLTEDGGNRITSSTGGPAACAARWSWRWARPASRVPTTRCRTSPPYGPPRNLAVRAPSPSVGCFPNPNGLALGRASDGSAYLFSANGGTNDVSVIDLARALRGDPRAEVGRIPTQVGPWGITATPDQRHVIVANGGSQRDGSAGNTLSVIDVDRAAASPGRRQATGGRSGPRPRRHRRSRRADAIR